MILNRQREVRVARRPLELFLRRVKRELGLTKSELTVCLMSDAEIARLNQDFRKKKGPTDVLSFPAARHKPVRVRRERTGTRRDSGNVSPLATRHSPFYLGDIAISPATARRYAKKNDRPVGNELRILILHGVLHLLGHDHETDRGEMDRIERKLRRRFGLS